MKIKTLSLFALISLLSTSTLGDMDSAFAELNAGVSEIEKLCVGGQGTINIENGKKVVGCTYGFKSEDKKNPNKVSGNKANKEKKVMVTEISGTVKGPVELTDAERAECAKKGSFQQIKMCERVLVMKKRLEMAKADHRSKRKQYFSTAEEISQKFAESNAEKKEEINLNCPIKKDQVEDRAAACKKYDLVMGSCSEDMSMANCRNLAAYEATTPDNVKNMCSATNKLGCVLFKKTLISCYKATKDLDGCLKGAQGTAKVYDALVKKYGMDSDIATQAFENCISTGKKSNVDCLREAESYMTSYSGATSSDECNGDIESLDSFSCRGVTYQKTREAKFLEFSRRAFSGKSKDTEAQDSGLSNGRGLATDR